MTSQWAALGQPNAGDGDQIIYYRRPRKGEDPGWIIWSDSLSGTKLRDKVQSGFEPLMQFGVINSAERDRRFYGDRSQPRDPSMTKERYIWEAILTHPDGPAEFPVEQVVAYRWYRPERCPVPDAYFPQLVGKQIKEYTCPERCGRPPFVAVEGAGGVGALRTHLRIMHGWDQANLQAYGARVGIDFNESDMNAGPMVDVVYGGQAPVTLSCERCGEEFTGAMAAARLGKHLKNHPVAVIETVGA